METIEDCFQSFHPNSIPTDDARDTYATIQSVWWPEGDTARMQAELQQILLDDSPRAYTLRAECIYLEGLGRCVQVVLYATVV